MTLWSFPHIPARNSRCRPLATEDYQTSGGGPSGYRAVGGTNVGPSASGSVSSRTSCSCGCVHGGPGISPSDSQRRMTGSDTLHTAAAWRTDDVINSSGSLNRLCKRTETSADACRPGSRDCRLEGLARISYQGRRGGGCFYAGARLGRVLISYAHDDQC